MLKSLRSQLLLLFLAISLIPLTTVMGIGYITAENTLEQELSKSLRAIAARQGALLNRIQRERLSEVGLMAQIPLVVDALAGTQGGLDPLNRYARQLVQQRGYENFYLVNREGVVVYTARPAPESGKALATDFPATELTRVCERVAKILETDCSDFRIHPPTGKASTFIATPVLGGGAVLGVLAVELSPKTALEGVNDYTGLGDTGETIVAVQDGTNAMLVSPTREDADAGFTTRVPLADAKGELLKLALEGGRGSGDAIDYRGVRVFASWRYLPALRWGVVVKIDHAEAFASVDRLRFWFLIALSASACLVAAIGIYMANALVKPIAALASATRRVANGEFSAPIEVKSNREIESLAGDFRYMVSHLNETFTRLKSTTEEREKAAAEALAYAEEAKAARIAVEEVNATLERKVEERTQELQQKNGALQTTLAQLTRTQQQLVAQEKMASLGQLTSGIAHEISNPLNFVNNFTDLSVELVTDLEALGRRSAPLLPAADRAEVEDVLPMLADNLEKIRFHGRRAEAIVRGMLEHTRSSSAQRDLVDVSVTLRDLMRTTYQGMRSRDANLEIEMVMKFDSQIGKLTLYGGEFSRAMANLIANAIWAAGERLRTAPPGFRASVEVETRLDGTYLHLFVRDNGIGIPPENVTKIYQPFFTTKPNGVGVGLGLSLAWEVLVNHHGGKIDVTSKVDSGTEFHIILPLEV